MHCGSLILEKGIFHVIINLLTRWIDRGGVLMFTWLQISILPYGAHFIIVYIDHIIAKNVVPGSRNNKL